MRTASHAGLSRFAPTWARTGLVLVPALALGVACAEDQWPHPPAQSREQFIADFNDWREERSERLVSPPAGPVILVGLWELNEGATPMGADSAMAIVLPGAQTPRRVGTIHRNGQGVRFEPAPRAGVRLADGTPVTSPRPLESDQSDSAAVLAIGSLRLRVHGEPGTDRLWLRGWDEAHPARESFRLPESYPPDTAWRLMARFDRYPEPRDYEVADVVGGTQAYRAPGELVFRVHGREYRLAANGDSGSTTLFIMFWDSTARTTTYEAGRYIRTPMPDSSGWTVIDFNRAYNPPCVFTAYSTCAFPPPENRLPLAIPTGEKRRRQD
jgi:uncharacterized protein (DUF1684 family)